MIELSEQFDFKKLLRFTFPSIVMLVFTSIYGVADGFFVSNFVGKTAFTAINFIMPFLMMLGCVGFLFGTGGSALVARIMGRGEKEKANRIFSFLIYISIAVGIILSILGIVILRPVAILLGGTGEMLENACLYGKIILITLPAYILQYEFQCLFATAEKPKLGLYVTILAGVTNIVLDAIFVAGFKWGLIGAAVATGIGQCVGGILPIVYFSHRNGSLLSLTKTKFEWKALLKTITNGFSELISNISMSMVSMLYNVQLLKYAGEDGIAVYGVLMYVGFVFQAIFIGYSVGVAPIISYHYGAESYDEVKSLLKKNLIVIAIFSILMFSIAELLSVPIANIFVGYDEDLFDLTRKAFFIFSFSFLLSGFSIMASSFFTALNDGFISATISFMRTLVFQVTAVLIFPILLGVNGIWWSIVGAEVMASLVSIKRKKYHYSSMILKRIWM